MNKKVTSILFPHRNKKYDSACAYCGLRRHDVSPGWFTCARCHKHTHLIPQGDPKSAYGDRAYQGDRKDNGWSDDWDKEEWQKKQDERRKEEEKERRASYPASLTEE